MNDLQAIKYELKKINDKMEPKKSLSIISMQNAHKMGINNKEVSSKGIKLSDCNLTTVATEKVQSNPNVYTPSTNDDVVQKITVNSLIKQINSGGEENFNIPPLKLNQK